MLADANISLVDGTNVGVPSFAIITVLETLITHRKEKHTQSQPQI